MRFFLLFLPFLFACGNDQGGPATEHHDSIHPVQPQAVPDSGRNMLRIMQANMDSMMTVRSTVWADRDFAALMRIHHQGAVDMARLELEQGKDPELKALAQQMINDQQKEISEFESYLSGPTKAPGDSSFYIQAMRNMHHMELKMDASGSVDKQFAQMMIPHHQGGIDMAKVYLSSGRNEAFKSIANNIISSQQKEIGILQDWLKRNQ